MARSINVHHRKTGWSDVGHGDRTSWQQARNSGSQTVRSPSTKNRLQLRFARRHRKKIRVCGTRLRSRGPAHSNNPSALIRERRVPLFDCANVEALNTCRADLKDLISKAPSPRTSNTELSVEGRGYRNPPCIAVLARKLGHFASAVKGPAVGPAQEDLHTNPPSPTLETQLECYEDVKSWCVLSFFDGNAMHEYWQYKSKNKSPVCCPIR
jgi:hypothetical protein